MDIQRFSTGALVALLLLIDPEQLFPQNTDLITSFHVVGNLDPVMKPNDTFRIMVMAKAVGNGTLDLRIGGFRPLFVGEWDARSVECHDTQICQLSDTLLISPSNEDYGHYSFNVIARFFQDGLLVEDKSRRVRIDVVPLLAPEPPFTQGTSNELCWSPFERRFNYELFRLETNNSQNFSVVSGLNALKRALPDSCDVVEGLPEGRRFGYQVTADDPSAKLHLKSNVVYSTQDQSPPPPAQIESFSVSQDGVVDLIWRKSPDAVSFIDRYVVYRKQVNVGSAFAAVDTLPFFPVSRISPANYFPVLAQLGQSIYTDPVEATSLLARAVGTEFEITSLPPALENAALVQTELSDRWNEQDDFISFNLETEAFIYIAFDADGRTISFPNWLPRDYKPTGKRVEVGNTGFRLFRSKQSFPAGQVTLGGNFASGANMRSKEPLMYAVFVSPVSILLPYASNQRIHYTDHLGAENDEKTFKYKIRTFDAAGNAADGPESEPIVIDLQGRCLPEVAQWFDFERADGLQFSRGFSNTVCVTDPNAFSACAGLRDTDSLRFQAARESVSFFDSENSDQKNTRFFDSEWIHVRDLAPPFCYQFDLLPEGERADFANAKTYFYRVQGKDIFGNLSAWSDTVSAVQDAFPPDDVASLTVESLRSADGVSGCNELRWSGGEDLVSGVQSYIIYRRNADTPDFVAIDTVGSTQKTYCDSLSRFSTNEVVQYRIGSLDNVGNLRIADSSAHEVSIRALVGPTIQFDSSELLTCATGQTRTITDSLTIFWTGFDITDVAGYDIDITQPGDRKVRKLLFDPTVSSVTCPLDAGDGEYHFRVRAFYLNRDTTTYSNMLAVRKKVTLQGVSNLRALQDERPTGNIVLDWAHPDTDEIDVFEIFVWQENEAQPTEPTAIVPGDVRGWVQDFLADGLVGYECNNYTVRARDCFGLVSDLAEVVTQYSNRPPAIDRERTEISSNRITIFWDRPAARVKEDDAFETLVLVYQDSVTSARFDSLRFINQTSFTLHNPAQMHNYIFQIKETILDDLGQSCSDVFVSAASGMVIVPFDNLPAPLTFATQPLPVHPDSTGGSVFVTWGGYADNAVSDFLVKYTSDSPIALADSFFVHKADTIQVANLDVTRSYAFEVLAVDSLGQRSISTGAQTASFSPLWLFTPKISGLTPSCFRDSLRLVWNWFDENLTPAGSSFNADSIFLELSVDPNFKFKTNVIRLGFSTSHTLFRDRDYAFVNLQNDILYARIMAQDKWGHRSFWSTEYEELGAVHGRFDALPPEVVTCFIDSVKAPVFGSPGEVDVHLRWQDVADGCSGTWYYEILRNDAVVGIDTSRDNVHLFIDRRVPVDDALLASEWRVQAVDSVGNRQQASLACRVPFVLIAPGSGGCADDSTFCWSEADGSADLSQVTYFVEGARFASLLGNPITNVTAGPLQSLCYDFSVPWEGIYWRVKARLDNFESAWSDTFFCALAANAQLTSVEAGSAPPKAFALVQNYSNPFNPSTTIIYAVPASENGAVHVILDVFNIAGQKVRSLVNGKKEPAEYSIVWDGWDDAGHVVSSGVYVSRIRTKEFVASNKLILMK